MRNSVRLGRMFGIDILLDYSWFLILVLITWSFTDLFSSDLFRPSIGRLETASYVLMGGLGAILFFASLLGHELSHALMARRKGITVASISLFVFGGVARLKGDPRTPGDEFKIAIVGPLASLGFGVAFLAIGYASDQANVGTAAAIFYVLGAVNLLLAVFNLLPGFPLDGGRILRSIVWKLSGDVVKATRVSSRMGRLVALLMAGWGAYRIVYGNQFVGGVWLILIALFLNQTAGSSYQQVLIRKSLGGFTVGDLMTREPRTIPGNVSLGTAVDEYFLRNPHSVFPVIGYGDQPEGLLTVRDLNEVPREQWRELTVRQVMHKAGAENSASPAESIDSILERLDVNPAGWFLVVDGESLVGVLSPSDLARPLRTESSV